MTRITGKELIEKIFHEDFEQLKGKQLRMTRIRVPSKEVVLAHMVSPSDSQIYHTLGLHIGVHEGEDHTGETLGLMRFTPWEAVVVAADIAAKSGNVEVCFMDRFCGALIISGSFSEVQSSMEEVLRFFREDLEFTTCKICRR